MGQWIEDTMTIIIVQHMGKITYQLSFYQIFIYFYDITADLYSNKCYNLPIPTDPPMYNT